MMKKGKHKLTLDRPATYQIKVPGHFGQNWSEWPREMTVSTESDEDNLPVTILMGTFDQAALHGLLRHLYSLGIPLISVNYVE
ncbi:MAG: hypothetical protein OEW48_21205 [Phycisphaerae bacterium]|nr:hypothetical protein [Phycisphaerae bacterium]